MTENNTTDAVDSEEGGESNTDSEVLKSLRSTEKAQAKRIKELENSIPNRADIEAEIRTSLVRERAIESQLTALGHPAGILETVDGRLGGAEVTRETVADALRAIGYAVSDGAEGGGENQVNVEGLANVASLGNQVASAARAESGDNFDAELAATETPEDITALMIRRGLGR